MAKKIFWLTKSDREAKYWACQAIARTPACEKFEFAVWRLTSMSLVEEINHGTVWECQRSYTRVEKTYRFMFETDEVTLTIEGRLPEYLSHVVHPTNDNRWFPTKATVLAFVDTVWEVRFGDDRKVTSVSRTVGGPFPGDLDWVEPHEETQTTLEIIQESPDPEAECFWDNLAKMVYGEE